MAANTDKVRLLILARPSETIQTTTERPRRRGEVSQGRKERKKGEGEKEETRTFLPPVCSPGFRSVAFADMLDVLCE